MKKNKKGTNQNLVKYDGSENALSVSQTYNADLVESIDATIRELDATITEESKEDEKKAKEAQKTLDDIVSDFKKLSADIQKQNKESKNIIDEAKEIKNGDGIKGKALAAYSFAGTVTDKIPLVGSLKSYVTRGICGDMQIHNAFQEQFNIATTLKDKLNTFLYGGDSSISKMSKILQEKIKNHGGELIKLKEESETNEDELDNFRGKKKPLVSDLEKKYHNSYNEIDLNKLSSNEVKKYNQIQDLDSKIFELENIKYKTDKRMKVVTNFIHGKRNTLATLWILHAEGQGIYDNIDGFLEEANTSISAVSMIPQFEQLIVQSARAASQLRENYNKILEMTSTHAAKIAKHGSYMVPDTLNKPKVLKKTMKNIRDVVVENSEKDPIGSTQRYIGAAEIITGESVDKKYRKALTGKTDKEKK